jgi:hypothetical protein
MAGQIAYVDVPYLLRSGSVQIPRPQNNNTGFGIGGPSYGGWLGDQSVTTVTVQTMEVVFRLEAPKLPLYIP